MENYENNLFKTANKLRGKIPPSDYKFYVLPLVFLRYVSLKEENGLWEEILLNCENDNIASIMDASLRSSINNNEILQNSYSNIYSESNLPAKVLKDLIYLIDEIDLNNSEEKIDYLGRIYEYFIGNFAATEGNRGGEFFTPPSVVNLLVNMLEPKEGIVYDPACGTGGMFIQSDKYSDKKLTFVGQEQNHKTILLGYMNGILHGLDLDIAHGDTLLNDCFPDLKADYVISNPPFNMKDWGAESLKYNDPRIMGAVNKNNANYMWIQHFVYHLKENGMAGFVISNGALTSSNEADKRTRKELLKQNIVDCVVQLPDKMFLGTAISSALIFINKNRKKQKKILFIDASHFGELVSKTQRKLKTDEIDTISNLYRNFRSNKKMNYNVKGFSWAENVDIVMEQDCKLMPSIYTGVAEKVIDNEANKKAIKILEKSLLEQIKISQQLGEKLMKELEYRSENVQIIRSGKNI